MLDVKTIRANKQQVLDTMRKKGRSNLSDVDAILSLDDQLKVLLSESQQLRASRNTLSEQINKGKKEGKDVSDVLAQVKALPQKIKEMDEKIAAVNGQITDLERKIPNIMHPDVPVGKDDSQNVDLKHFGEPTTLDFPAKSHQEIAVGLGMADFESAANTSGNGFYYMQGDLALLNQALLRFAIDIMVSHNFTYVETPYLVRGDVIRNVVDLNDQENQIYKINDEDLFLIGTSEHSLIGRYIGAVVDEKQLPVRQTSFSMCFRREKGSHGIDERGFYRTHQFNKIEMVVICKPEESMKQWEQMRDITLEIFTKLGVPIRVLGICSGDLGDLKHIQVDIEAWSPRRNGYFEVGSCSNLTEAQSRMLGIKAQRPNGEKYYPHTLNNTAIATSRALVAILENNQTKEGTVKIPQVLWPYMYGKKELVRVR